ncbi:Alpha crystallin/Hsp20 domain [Macleaya cordata]|uniref:Alpha crystallin/Hsp20 domain n=1 Tax=Macleaya cordata TaxID=56857 RepID=A0A200PTB3_MACCD|nr:Alpha crystallin/Hsp20 domain [Macleaya cordata]
MGFWFYRKNLNLHGGNRGELKVLKASTPVDITEYPYFYEYIIEMTGLKSEEINVQLFEENEQNVLVISGNSNIDEISAVYQDGLLTVTVLKLQPPSEQKKQRIILVENGN